MTLFERGDWTGIDILSVIIAEKYKKGAYIKAYGTTRHHQLTFKLGGRSEIVYGGRQLDYDKGTVLFLPQEKQTTIEYNKKIMEEGTAVCISFVSSGALPSEGIVVKPSSEDGLEALFLKLSNIWKCKGASYYPDSMELFFRIISRLKRLSGRDSGDFFARNRLAAAVEYIHSHFCDSHIDLYYLAELADMKYDYFRKLFTETYRVPPVKYISRMKISYSKELLASGLYSVGDVAEMTGFSDASYFNRVFREQTGVSPSRYEIQK